MIAVIKNPGAGSVDGDSEAELLSALQKSGLRYELFESENPSDSADEAIRYGCVHLIACGGDGTVAGVANSILRSSTPDLRLSIVPLGTGNIIAAAIGLPSKIDECVAIAARSTTKKIDAGRIGNDYFLLGIGIGATESFVTESGDDEKKKFGRLAYIAGLIRSTHDPLFRVDIQSDNDQCDLQAQAVTLANYWGTRRVEMLDGTADDDGEMECVVTKRLSAFNLLKLAVKGLLGNLGSDNDVRVIKGTRFTIDTKPTLPVQLDGNETEIKTPIQVEVIRQAIEISVPD